MDDQGYLPGPNDLVAIVEHLVVKDIITFYLYSHVEGRNVFNNSGCDGKPQADPLEDLGLLFENQVMIN